MSLSDLARAVESVMAMRHRIKRIDRLLGNGSLHRAQAAIYEAVAAQWQVGIEQVFVVVDWSDATTDQRWHLLRASVVVEGCGMTLTRKFTHSEIWGAAKYIAGFLRALQSCCQPVAFRSS